MEKVTSVQVRKWEEVPALSSNQANEKKKLLEESKPDNWKKPVDYFKEEDKKMNLIPSRNKKYDAVKKIYLNN